MLGNKRHFQPNSSHYLYYIYLAPNLANGKGHGNTKSTPTPYQVRVINNIFQPQKQ